MIFDFLMTEIEFRAICLESAQNREKAEEVVAERVLTVAKRDTCLENALNHEKV